MPTVCLPSVLFPPPPSILLTTASAATILQMAYTAISEASGRQHLQYSKFASPSNVADDRRSTRIPSRAGMLSVYTPALAAALAAFPAVAAAEGTRALLLCSALALHFLKRDLEVMFVHKYSGHMVVDSVIGISLHYFFLTVLMIYAQHVTVGTSEPTIDLKYIGVALFLVGILGNFYHHYILSKLRKKDEKEYKIPKGGLFGLVICPHYLFEILGFVGMAFISQTWTSVAFAVSTTFYLAGRSIATRKWYLSKFENFPVGLKALVPFVF